MTVSYSQKCFERSLATYIKLLFLWRGSVFKILYKEALIFVAVFVSISLIYSLALNEEQKSVFKLVVDYCKHGTSILPLTMVMGNFVSFVVSDRWNKTMAGLPWPDRYLSLIIATYVRGDHEEARMLRRNIVRYMILCQAVKLRDISRAVKKRMPTMEHLMLGGLMTMEECEWYKSMSSISKKPKVNLYSAAAELSMATVYKAYEKKLITDEFGFVQILKEISSFRSRISNINSYDWISVPLVYTQVVTLAVYTFFLASVIANQYVYSDDVFLKILCPLFSLLQFLFYMGWLKVAEVLINPLGCDDDDFEMNYLLDRNIKVAYLIVDNCYGASPPLENTTDKGERKLSRLPNSYQDVGGSVSDLKIPTRKQTVVAIDKDDNRENSMKVKRK